jgi:hypothetical protein
MSESASRPSRLPPRPSLEQLRKQAKELSASTGVPLAEAQFNLARQYGFESWAKLAHHVESLQPPTLSQLERLAKDIVAAYATGDPAALERVQNYLRSLFSPQTVRARLHDHLGVSLETNRNDRLTLADAETFVARAHGFESWTQLVQHMSPKRSERTKSDTAPPYQIDWKENRISPRHALTKEDWDTLIDLIAEERITGLDAGGQMTDDVLEKVSRFEHLTHLGISGSDRLTDDGVRHVARLERLEQLDVGGSRSAITDRGLEVLRHLPELKRFNAWWSQRVSDVGMSNLRFCDRLESVDVMGTHTGDGTLEALAGKRELRQVKTGRLVTDAGLQFIHQIPAFKSWQGGEPRYELMSYNGKPTHVMLDGPFTNKGLATLAGLDGLTGLSLFWHVSGLTPDGLEPLARLPRLGFLGCEGNLCDDRAMRHIAAIPGLRMLMAQGTIATDDGFIALSRSPTLAYIWGRECPNLTGRGFGALAALPSLRGLGVSCKRVEDAALSALPRCLSLVELMPMDVSDHGFRHVGACENLETLWCMYCRETGDVATAHIASLSKLKKYYAGNTRITDASLEILGRMSSLEWMEFWHSAGITDAGIAHLATLPRLREISVSGAPKVTRAGMEVFPPTVRASYST